MTEQISDTELLDLNDRANGDFMENQPTQNTDSAEWIDTQTNSREEELKHTTHQPQEAHEDKTQKNKKQIAQYLSKFTSWS